MDKKKKIIIGVAIVLAIALVIGLFFLLNKEKEPPVEEQEVTVRYLMELNEEYFKTLDSVDVTVTFEHDYVSKIRDNEIKGLRFIEANTKKMFKNGLTEAVVNIKNSEQSENRNYNVEGEQKLYIVTENGKETKYVQETVGGVKSLWVINPEQKQLYGFTDTTDFNYIGKYWLGLDIANELVEVDGVSCYKVTGQINSITAIAEHYGIENILAIGRVPYESYVNVELYFRADNYIIHSFSYDFTDYWLDTYAVVDTTGFYTNDGTMKLSVKYNGFNTVKEIMIEDMIFEEAEELLKDPYQYPIDMAENLYEVYINDIKLKIGTPLKTYKESLTFNTNIRDDNGYIENDIIYVNSQTSLYVEGTTANNHAVLLNVINNNEHAVPLDECVIYQIYINSVYSSYNVFNIANEKINKDSSITDIVDVWGKYNMKADTGVGIEYTWRCYDDWTDISVVFNRDTNKIDAISVYCFNLPNKLAGWTLADYQKWQEEQFLAEQKKLKENNENTNQEESNNIETTGDSENIQSEQNNT